LFSETKKKLIIIHERRIKYLAFVEKALSSNFKQYLSCAYSNIFTVLLVSC